MNARKLSYPAVSQYMSTELIFAEADTSVPEIMESMKQNGIRHMPVLDIGGHPIGLISDRDTKIFTNLEWASKFSAEHIMTRYPACVLATSALSSVAQIMIGQKLDAVLVVDNEGEIEGIFTSFDALRAMNDILTNESSEEQAPSEAIFYSSAS